MRRVVKLFVMVMVVSAMIGCSASSKFMKKESADSIKASGGTSKVIFYRVSSLAKGIAPVIITSEGKYLGEALPKSQYAVTLPAGKYTFTAWSEATHTMKANLKAGKTYFVRVGVNMGAWSARFNPVPVKPGTEDWKIMEKDIKKCEYYSVDFEGGQKKMVDSRKPEDVKSVIAKGEKRWSEYPAEEQKERTLNPEDGI